MTPATFRAWIKGYLDVQQAMREGKRHEDYNLAVMFRAAMGSNRMPSFEQVFPDSRRGSREPMTDEQMYQQVLALNAALGGSVIGG